MAFVPAGSGYDNRAFDTVRAAPIKKRCARCGVPMRSAQKLYCKPCSMDVAEVNRSKWAKDRHAQRKTEMLAEKAALAEAKGWECEDEALCEWPLCGCDPDANKVIAAIEEAFTLTPAGRRERLQEPSSTPDAPFLLP